MARMLFLFIATWMTSPVHAQTIAVASFDGAMARTSEGRKVTSRIESSMNARQSELMRQQNEFERAVEEYQKGALVMSAEARATKEQDLATQQASLQQAAMTAQNELTEMQTNLVYQLSEKLRVVVGRIAVEKGYDLVLDASSVPFVGSSVIDITDLLVQRYDAENP